MASETLDAPRVLWLGTRFWSTNGARWWGHTNYRHEALLRRLPFIQRRETHSFDVWGLRGIQSRLERAVFNPILQGPRLRKESHHYGCIWLGSGREWLIKYSQAPVIFDDDDPTFTRDHVAQLNHANVRAVVTTTEILRSRLRQAGLRTPCVVIPSGVDLSRVDIGRATEIAEQVGRVKGVPIVGFTAPTLFLAPDRTTKTLTGRLRDVSFLLAAMERVWATEPATQVWLVGRPSARLRMVARRDRRIRLLGYTEPVDLLPTLMNIDIAVYPRNDDVGGRTSLKLLDFLACGLPVVATDVSEATIVREAGAGIVATTKDAFADAILKLIRDPAARRDLGAHGQRYTEGFDWSVSARRYRREVFDLYVN